VRKVRYARAGRASTIGGLLEEFLARTESRARVKEKLGALVWRDVVGDFYAERTRVTRVHQGIMYIGCESPALAHQLSLDAAEIARRLNRELAGPYIKEIRPATGYRGRGEAQGRPAPPRRPTPSRSELEAIALPAEDVAAIDAEAAQIGDEDLRERFRKAAVADRRARLWREAHGYRPCRACAWLLPPEAERCGMCGEKRTSDLRPQTSDRTSRT